MQDSLHALTDVLADADSKLARGESAAAEVWSTGFPVLDEYLGGGLRAGELTLLGGPQGLGKTTFALQMLRNVGVDGRTGVFFSYEHDASTMMAKLLALESGEALGLDGLSLAQVRATLQQTGQALGDLVERFARLAGGTEAVSAVAAYSDRVFIHESSGKHTDIDQIRRVIQEVVSQGHGNPVVVVDYLQKIPLPGSTDVEEERVTTIVETLKDLALEMRVPILAIVAADKEGIAEGKRLRTSHLRGSSALAYEPDVVLILNDKYDIVARHHLVYDLGNAERFRGWAVVTIEKNRGGLNGIDLEFRKRFEQSRFEVGGKTVEEQLVDERVFVE